MIFKKYKNKIISASAIIITLLYFPELAFAQGGAGSFKELVLKITSIFTVLITLTMGLALFYFLFGILKYMTQYGDEKARGESVKTISYGLIALFVMVAVWGIVAILRQSLLGEGGIRIPQF